MQYEYKIQTHCGFEKDHIFYWDFVESEHYAYSEIVPLRWIIIYLVIETDRLLWRVFNVDIIIQYINKLYS